MSVLVLVRHGQARAFQTDPDRLSETGRRQARSLGRYWVKHGVRFDAAFHGSLRRQQESCRAVAEAYRAAGVDFPDPAELPGLDEYQVQDMLAALAPRLAETDAAFAPLWRAWRKGRETPERNRYFQRMFEVVMKRWAEGTLDAEGIEPWNAFRERVLGALEVIFSSQGGGRRVAAFSSGGPIAVAVQTALRAPDAAALELNWRIRNASLTTLLFSGSRLSLDGFNALPHLAERPDLVTFR